MNILLPRSKPVQEGKWKGEIQALSGRRCHLMRVWRAWKSNSFCCKIPKQRLCTPCKRECLLSGKVLWWRPSSRCLFSKAWGEKLLTSNHRLPTRPVRLLRDKMMRHYGPDDDNDCCWYNYAHKGGPEQPNFLKTGGVTSKHFFTYHISKCAKIFLHIS